MIKEVDGIQIQPIGFRAVVPGINGVVYSVEWVGDSVVVLTIDTQTRQRLGRMEYATKGHLDQREQEAFFRKLIREIKRRGAVVDAYNLLNEEARKAIQEKVERLGQTQLQAQILNAREVSDDGSD